MLKWVKSETAYAIEIKQGKAVIQENERNGSKLYVPKIEDKAGKLVASFEHGFDDFETANAFIHANLIELDRVGIDDTEFTNRLLSTLDICLPLLDEPNRAFHHRRIKNIKSWLSHARMDFNLEDLPRTDWSAYDLKWTSDGDIYRADVSPHGMAFIQDKSTAKPSKFKFGTAGNYHIQIKDNAGITFVDAFQNYVDFAAAEDRLREILSELEKPFVEEIYVEHLAFTLQICQQLLPANSELIHYIRLDYLKNYLAEVLP